MIKNSFFTVLTMVIILASSKVFAIDIADYEKFKRTEVQDLKLYIRGVWTGYGFSNSLLKYEGRGRLFCLGDASLNDSDRLDVIDWYIQSKKRDKSFMSESVEVIFLLGLRELYPCK